MTSLFNRFVRSLTGVLVLLLIVSAADADAPFSFETAPGKLPKTVIPVHYAIELTPDLESLALPGVETIDIEVREPTARIILNAVDTTFESASIDDGAQRAEVTLDATAQTATLSFAQPITTGAHRLRIAFTARINKFGTGLFTVDYPTAGGTRRLISSKLEPATRAGFFRAGTNPRSRRASRSKSR